MKKKLPDSQQLADTETSHINEKEQKDQIRLKIPGVSFVIITNANQIITITIILCVFIITMTLIVKMSFFIPDWHPNKVPADKLSAGSCVQLLYC
jgi:hypothetical protein